MSDVTEPLESVDEIDEYETELGATPASVVVSVPGNTGQTAGYVRGDMVQLNYFINKLRRAHALSQDYVDEVIATFVDREFSRFAGGHTRLNGVVETLRRRRCVVLLGSPGAGRRAAGVAALAALDLPLQELPPWDLNQPDQFDLSEHKVLAGRGYLLILPDEGQPPAELLKQLRLFRDRLASADSFLAMAATTTMWAAVEGQRDESVFIVGDPDGHQLLKRRVAFQLPGHDLGAALDDPAIRSLAADARPGDVMRLADVVVAATTMSSTADPADPHDLVAEITNAYQEWQQDLERWFRDHPSAQDRLFIIAAAALEGSAATLVLRAAEDLGARFDTRHSGARAIESAGIRELALNVEAQVRPDATIGFRRPAYASAVLDFVLSDRSEHFRRTLQKWLAELPSHHGMSQARVAAKVADLVLELVLRHRDIGFAVAMTVGWKRLPRLRPILVDLLTAVALSTEGGPAMRGKLYEWARRTDRDYLRVVIGVCAGQFADVYPRIALTRINHVAVRADQSVHPELVEAMTAMWQRPALRGVVLERVLGWLTDSGTVFALGCAALARLSEPDSSADPVHVARHLGAGAAAGMTDALRRVLAGEPTPLRDLLYAWFDQGAADRDFGEWLIAVFAGAIDGPGSALRAGRVRLLADQWRADEIMPEQQEFRERLIDRVHRADPMIWSWGSTGLPSRGGASDDRPAMV